MHPFNMQGQCGGLPGWVGNCYSFPTYHQPGYTKYRVGGLHPIETHQVPSSACPWKKCIETQASKIRQLPHVRTTSCIIFLASGVRTAYDCLLLASTGRATAYLCRRWPRCLAKLHRFYASCHCVLSYDSHGSKSNVLLDVSNLICSSWSCRMSYAHSEMQWHHVTTLQTFNKER